MTSFPRLYGLRNNLTQLTGAIDLGCFGDQPDSKATCHNCGSFGIAHGHVDLGGVDYYDNYFAYCPHCFWAFHTEQYAMSGSEEAVWDFDYSTNTYHWPYLWEKA
jgi:hypothetical protein